MANRDDQRRPDRREFLKESAGGLGALALGAAYAPAASPAPLETIGVGVIGVGNRGGALLQWVDRLSGTHHVRVTAVCDLWERRREAAASKVLARSGRRPASCRVPAELLERPDVDAVIIATADFQHCYLAAEAVRAGKDVYVETPFGSDFAQVRRAYEEIAASGRVFQIGTQARGADKYFAAARFVQAGMLGQVTYVEISEPIFQQRWRATGIEPPLSEGDIDWRAYLCYLPPETPFNPRHFREFRLFRPYSTGPFCQWMTPRIDLVNLVLGKLPIAAVALGGVFLWKDGRDNPDTMQCLLEYPGGTLVNYHMRMGNRQHGRATTFYGTCGTLELENALAYGDGGGGLVCQAGSSGGESGSDRYVIDRSRQLRAKREGGFPLDDGGQIDYLGHFFDCVRSRTKPRGDLQAAFGQSVATLLGATAFDSGVRMAYDPADRQIKPWQPDRLDNSTTRAPT